MPSKKRELMETYEAVDAAQDRILQKKFCSSCQNMKPIETGKFVSTANKRVKRWKCGDCLARQSSRIYQAKEKLNEQ